MLTPDTLTRWRRITDDAASLLHTVSDETARRRPAPGKWSIKEIVGHLIDSAANNHRRFIIAQIRDGLVFDGYEQNEWITLQRYQEASWPELVTLWQLYNHHLIHAAEAIPPSVLSRPQTNHNFYDIASRAVPKGEPTTLRFLIDDYVFHLEHHVKQITALV